MTLIVLAGMVVVVTALVLVRRGPAGVRDGLSMSFGMLRQVAPMLLLGMFLAGMTQVILPADLVGRWMGSESGIVGVLIGTAVGSLVPAGPFVVFPLLGSTLATGAGVGAVAAFITAWSVRSRAPWCGSCRFLAERSRRAALSSCSPSPYSPAC